MQLFQIMLMKIQSCGPLGDYGNIFNPTVFKASFTHGPYDISISDGPLGNTSVHHILF